MLTPWFLCSIFGQFWVQSLESQGGLYQWKKECGDYFPGHGSDLYVFPTELIPYFPENLKDYKVKTVDDLGMVSRDIRDVFILDLNNWKSIRTARDEMIMMMIDSDRLSHGFVIKEYSSQFSPFRNYILLDYKHEIAGRILENGVRSSSQNLPGNVLALALPEDQKTYEGWSVLEMDKDNRFFRWGVGDISRIRFNHSLEPGDYVAHLVGYRSPYPLKQVWMKFRVQGEKDEIPIFQDEGIMHIRIPVRLTRRHGAPTLIVRQSSWRPSDYIEGSHDGRNLTFLFMHAWLE
jgi:hypothetical protein